MTEKVTRLPVQHPGQPHCENCNKPMPNFQSLMLSGFDLGDCILSSVTFHVQCSCGVGYDIQNDIGSVTGPG